MGDLFLVRHGETAWSRGGRHTGLSDVPLTGHGRDQARSLMPLIRSHRIGAAFVSPFQRTRETAELIGLDGAEVDADLHEWDYGGYEGITTVEIHRSRPDWFLFTDGVVPGPPGHPGESPEQVGERADRVLARVEINKPTPSMVSANGSISASSVKNEPWMGTAKIRRIKRTMPQNSAKVSTR